MSEQEQEEEEEEEEGGPFLFYVILGPVM